MEAATKRTKKKPTVDPLTGTKGVLGKKQNTSVDPRSGAIVPRQKKMKSIPASRTKVEAAAPGTEAGAAEGRTKKKKKQNAKRNLSPLPPEAEAILKEE